MPRLVWRHMIDCRFRRMMRSSAKPSPMNDANNQNQMFGTWPKWILRLNDVLRRVRENSQVNQGRRVWGMGSAFHYPETILQEVGYLWRIFVICRETEAASLDCRYWSGFYLSCTINVRLPRALKFCDRVHIRIMTLPRSDGVHIIIIHRGEIWMGWS